ncbi:molecular chaperone GroES [Bifidobacterium animalis subsp. animalis MCC 0483]|uniref:Molecular chaperone GroES n=1 Tax=Bifidobacterium animalis subsp. animalis MCC 0483 TaxID=1365955 RepID=A0AB34T8U7_9BIFI|nr:alcohol dehydrogenase catalytic domain-containing protein [Bifidobacterium animalis]KOA49157.1 molecular chaperone GroES [Bifidobacterium animalis subsp. animalis MCC 0483]KOA54050.1 molecular chaperone GroES [Bifidobacterium animalis subsp. animalis ATCC 27672]KOA58765.1 molecular chaperone GroES [Bifidobacterium animalis subsp. animalis MCC 0499]MCR1996109.1 alcohol dehydrogenase catalytic domain-containing protein [Bifidobacterium animalis subsp. animalis]UQE62841.1 alcohol dehydrogenase
MAETMKSAIFESAGHMAIEDVPMPRIEKPDDAIIRIVRTCVCGSDLWPFRGINQSAEHSQNSGHEAIGIVEQVGDDITSVKPGDFVIAPFTHGCGQCRACRAGFDGSCMAHDDNFSMGAQGQYIRFQHAQWALVKIPGRPEDYSEDMLKSLLTLSDVMATGYHAARTAQVKPGDTVIVLGDGAVGQCAIIAAKMMGAKRIISTSRHDDRRALAAEFGATDNVAERGDEGVAKLLEISAGGADAVLECVGTDASFQEAVAVARPGALIGRVGLPHAQQISGEGTFYRNIGVYGGPASVTTYDKNVLLDAVLDAQINPGKVFTNTFELDEIQPAYEAMDERKTIKSYVIVEH